MTALDHFWTAAEAVIAAALELDPERTRALICERAPTPEERAAQNLEIIVAAVGKNAGARGRALRDHARTEAREMYRRGLSGAESDEAVRVALAEGLIRREGDKRTGYRYTPGHTHDTPRQRTAVEAAQKHVRTPQTTEATPDAQHDPKRRDRSGDRAGTTHRDTNATQEMSDMSDTDGRETQEPIRGETDGSPGSQASERVTPFERSRP